MNIFGEATHVLRPIYRLLLAQLNQLLEGVALLCLLVLMARFLRRFQASRDRRCPGPENDILLPTHRCTGPQGLACEEG